MILSVQNLNAPLRIDIYLFECIEADETLREKIPSRSQLQSMIKRGEVKLNGVLAKKNMKVSDGDLIELTLKEREYESVLPEKIPLEIVYEDKDLIVVNKARGMVVHPAPGNYTGTLVNALLYHVRNSAEKSFFEENLNITNEKVRPGIVHRIDKDTTGLLMVAKNADAHFKLSGQLGEKSVTRRYLALVHGGFKEAEGKVDAPIARHRLDRLKMAVDLMGKHAVTRYKVLEKLGSYSLLELRLETGRTHQIRVHMRHIKHPVVGDSVYGAKSCPYTGMGQLLHAECLGFIHPKTGAYLEFHAPLPDDFRRVLEKERARQEA